MRESGEIGDSQIRRVGKFAGSIHVVAGGVAGACPRQKVETPLRTVPGAPSEPKRREIHRPSDSESRSARSQNRKLGNLSNLEIRGFAGWVSSPKISENKI